jgi:hypothetical protein
MFAKSGISSMLHQSSTNPYAVASLNQSVAAYAADAERLTFLQRTYAHLTGAVLALIAIEAVLFTVVPRQVMEGLVQRMMGGYGWLLVLGGFMVVSWVARAWATSGAWRLTQYAGLSLYVVAEAVLLLPLLYICISVLKEPNLPIMAAAITAMCFIGLTVFVFVTGADFSGWGKYLAMAGLVAMGVMLAGIFFGFSMGLWFSGLMVALACGYILYDTSNMLYHYHTSQYVAASLALFASVVLLFWYVLRIMMSFSNQD